MAAIFEFETRQVDEARLRFTETGIPSMGSIDTPLWYNARMGRIEGDQAGFATNRGALELALCTIQENGSAEKGYQSISQAPTYKVALFIGARSDDHLLVSDIAITNEQGKSELLHPARLALKDLIGYRTLR